MSIWSLLMQGAPPSGAKQGSSLLDSMRSVNERLTPRERAMTERAERDLREAHTPLPGGWARPAPPSPPRPERPSTAARPAPSSSARRRAHSRPWAEDAADRAYGEIVRRDIIGPSPFYPDNWNRAVRERAVDRQARMDNRVRELGGEPSERNEEVTTRARVLRNEAREPDVSEHPLTRAMRLNSTRELTHEEYAALTPRQRAAVEFNTGLVRAARADDESGNNSATKDYLTQLGIETSSSEQLDEYLRLDRLISESILAGLENVATRHDTASSLRWARGDRAAAGERATRDMAARNAASDAGAALATSLSTTGRRIVDAPAGPRPGFGATTRDQVIQAAYLNMVDSAFDLGPDDVAEGIAALNAEQGTDVTPQEVWDYLDSQLNAAGFRARRGNAGESLPLPEVNPLTGQPLSPLDVAEIRRRYGL